MRLIGSFLLALVFSSQLAYSQCNWTQVYYESYEYTTTIPYLISGTTYQNTPQTYAGCVRTGTYGLYMNFVNGFSGLAYSQPFTDICIGKNYRFSFSTRDAFNSTNNLTFNVKDANNTILSTLNVINDSIWNDVTMPAFTATTTSITFEIITNMAGTGGNDAGFDDLRLWQCQPQPTTYNALNCLSVSTTNLYNYISSPSLSNNGTWTGPSTLSNGYLGTFTNGTNSNGVYTYTITGTAGCPDSSAIIQAGYVQTPTINSISNVSTCGNYILPAINGSNLSGFEAYYSGTGGTGTAYHIGDVISNSITLFAYDGASGCSDEKMFTVTITAPQTAGTDNGYAFCNPVGTVPLSALLSSNASTGGNWQENNSPATNSLNASNGNVNTNLLASGAYSFYYIIPATGSCVADTAEFIVTIDSLQPINLGNDTTICPLSSLTLDAGTGFNVYLWDNNTTNQTRTVSAAGTYYVKGGTIGSNLIINGDFEQGNTGFSTDYVVGTSGTWGPLSDPGTYAITTSPNLVHTNFTACTDHTSGSGTQMMVVNGAGTANTDVWCQTVTVQPYTDYYFSAWVSNALNDANVAQLQFEINNSTVGSIFTTAVTGCTWQQFYQVWNSGLVTSAQICLLNQNTNTGGNDFMVDDISFQPVCFSYDTIVVSNYVAPVVTASPTSQTICSGNSAELTASSSSSPISYNWTPGNLSGDTIHVFPTTASVYSVTGTDAHGCVSNVSSASVLIQNSPVVSISSLSDSICYGNSLQLNANSSMSNTIYEWSSGETTPIITVSPTSDSNFILAGTSVNGCIGYDTIAISVIPQLQVHISGISEFCEGYSSTLTASGNQNGMTFFWLPVASSEDSLTITAANSGWLYLYGSYFGCPNGIDSVFVTENPNPEIIVPENMSVCPGEAVTVSVSSDQPNSTFVWQPGNLSGDVNTLVSESTTTYYVYAQNGNCVSETDSFTIDMSMACYLEVPNVFTPNNDQSNDYFSLISYAGIKTIEVTILNRWGNVINTYNLPDFKWDGKDQGGNDVSEGVYFYKIKATTGSGENLESEGFVELIRK